MTSLPVTRLAAVFWGALGLTVAQPAAAQERLGEARVVRGSVSIDRISFGRGLTMEGTDGGTDLVRNATQLTLPMSLLVPIGERWTFDVGAAFTAGSVTFADRTTPGLSRTVKLDGVSDVRLRATGRILGEHLLLTLGANLPLGVRELGPDAIAALSVLAAPVLGLQLPAVSFGPGATTGVVLAASRGDWAWAAATSFEVRGQFSPVAALTAGLPSPRFDPGNAVHVALSTDGPIGQGALNAALTIDLYTQDRLLAAGGGAGAGTVRLGPTFGAEVQLHLPVRRFRELTIYAFDQFRAAFERDGAPVTGTSGNYLTAGVRGALPITPATAITGVLEAWHHTGLAVDHSLVTAATTSGTVTLGASHRRGRYEALPFVRLRGGSIDTGLERGAASGWSAGLTLSTRF